jgi:SAM-dependent methyltransferase
VQGAAIEQEVHCRNWVTGQPEVLNFTTAHFNIERDRFPFADAVFDVVLCCEILEHLLQDPLAALQEIKRVLKPSGALILTTPNVSRLENVARLLAGQNLYDPYSGYGPYGRHNREYTADEVQRLLEHTGFGVDLLFTADVHTNRANHFCPVSNYGSLLQGRADHLGQYLFVRARNDGTAHEKKPAFLYRSYPEGELL